MLPSMSESSTVYLPDKLLLQGGVIHENPRNVKWPKLSSKTMRITGLNLTEGKTYYVRHIFCNPAGLCSTSRSGGVISDSTPPDVEDASVLDIGSDWDRDIDYKHAPKSVQVIARGFSDCGSRISTSSACASGILSYRFYLGTAAHPREIIFPQEKCLKN